MCIWVCVLLFTSHCVSNTLSLVQKALSCPRKLVINICHVVCAWRMLVNDVYYRARVIDLALVATLCAWNNNDPFPLHSHVCRNLYNDAGHVYRDNTCETDTREYSTSYGMSRTLKRIVHAQDVRSLLARLVQHQLCTPRPESLSLTMHWRLETVTLMVQTCV